MKVLVLILAVLILGLLALFSPFYLAAAAPLAQTAQEGQALFQKSCSSCHTIGGGKLVGPDLEGVTGRRDLDWVKNFILDPAKMLTSGDPVAAQLLKEYNNLPMPDLGLSEAEAEALLTYLENPQAADQAEAQSAAAQAEALPPGQALAGQRLFTGKNRLAGGGTGCIACHSVEGAGALGGGSLGPDLTGVYARLGGAGLASSLSNIQFPTMQGPFANRPLTPQEQSDLIAYFAWANESAPVPTPGREMLFLGAGVLGALVLFGLLAFSWPRQRESLSARLRRMQ